jgi:hypothetical protein
MENPLVKAIIRNAEIEVGKRLQVDELVVRATVPEVLWGYGLPLESLCVSEEEHDLFLLRHIEKLAPRGSNFSVTKRGKKFFIVHACMWESTCEVFEEEISKSNRVWRPETFGHRIIVPKIN